MLPRSLQRTIEALLTPAVFLSLWLAVTPAWAGSMLLLGAGGAGAGGTAPTLAFIASVVPTVTSNVATATAASIGTASSDRLVVVVAYDIGANPTLGTLALTIGGVTATSDIIEGINGSVTVVYQLLVTSGTTANIVWTTDQAVTGGVLFAVYTIKSLSSTTPTGSGGNTSASTTSLTTANLTTSASGVAIIGTGTNINASSNVVTGTTGTITQDDPNHEQNGNNTTASATSLSASASSNYTMTTNAAATASIAAVAWR